jgi:hypothetical protein
MPRIIRLFFKDLPACAQPPRPEFSRMPKPDAPLAERIAAEQDLSARFSRIRLQYLLSKPPAEVERELETIATELEPLISEPVPRLASVSFVQPSPAMVRVGELFGFLWSRPRAAWNFEPALTVEEWSAFSPDELTARVRAVATVADSQEIFPLYPPFPGFHSEALKPPLHAGKADSPLQLATDLVQTIIAATKLPLAYEIEHKFWNRAREFNPQRLLSLRIHRMFIAGLPGAGRLTLEFSGVAEALELPEKAKPRGLVIWPAHPTLPVPWRCCSKTDTGFYEQSLGSSLEDALLRCARDRLRNIGERSATIPMPTLSEAVEVVFEGYHDRVEDYSFAPDSPHMNIINAYSLAAGANALALKAREVWFQRYRELLEPALPAARRATLFLLEPGKPRSPFRTFVARLPRELPMGDLARPVCPECGLACDVVANLNFTHHDLPFALPGPFLLLHTCREHDFRWHARWMARTAKAELETALQAAEECVAGPAVRVVEFDYEKVDQEILARPSEKSDEYKDSRCQYRMFASSNTKVGGGVFWIQSNPSLVDSAGNLMTYIGQVGCNEFLTMGDSGVAYVLYAPETGEVKVHVQFY